MSILEQKNPSKQGDVGVAHAIAWFQKEGYIVCMPLSDSQCYDFVADIGSRIVKVQVKTTKFLAKDGHTYIVGLKTDNVPMDTSRIDYLFVMSGNEDQYCIPAKDLEVSTKLHLGYSVQDYLVSCGGIYLKTNRLV